LAREAFGLLIGNIMPNCLHCALIDTQGALSQV
jgi:hypothetical protein